MNTKLKSLLSVALLVTASALPVMAFAKNVKLLNVSYDPTREFYVDYNQAFGKFWEKESGDKITFQQSHGGSGAQARSVIDGLEADVITLGVPSDTDAVANAGLLSKDWQARLPNGSSPYTSTIVFLVRKGNPWGIKDWGDLVKDGIQVVTPNPKTSAGARYNYLAAYGWALDQFGGDEAKAKDFVSRLYRNVPVLDSGARGSTVTFTQRGVGDVLLAWENEAYLAIKEAGPGKYDVIVPPTSILAEPPVAVVDSVVDHNGTRKVAEAYLKYLYSEEGQDIAAKWFYRPRSEAVAARYAGQFPKVKTFTVDEKFGGWKKAQPEHFGNGGVFDQIYKPGR